jgi:DNA polymerase
MAGEDWPVGGEVETIGIAEARSALAWWLEAGVDVAVQEEPRDWLRPPARSPGKVAETPAPVPNISQPTHETLAELQQWLSSSAQVPVASVSSKRILPHGPENAPVMLLSSPTIEDAAAGQPISGDAWVLATRMLAAIGIQADHAYSASLSWFHAPGAKASDEHRQELGELARKHIRLAKPMRLILFGDAPCRALLGKPIAQARGHVHRIEGVRTVATFHPRHLINRPLDKSLAWKDLLLLMEEES